MGADPSRARARKRGMGNMVKLSDESARARFADELDRNFSVVASAGSGKTTAITQRVLSIARSVNAVEILPRLVVVTFTNRAADEMQQRARQIQQVTSGIVRVGKTLRWRLGIFALAGLFRRRELEFYGFLVADVLAIAQMDQRRCDLRGGGSTARFSRFSTRARIRHVRRSNRAGERIAATSGRSTAHSRRKDARHSR